MLYIIRCVALIATPATLHPCAKRGRLICQPVSRAHALTLLLGAAHSRGTTLCNTVTAVAP